MAQTLFRDFYIPQYRSEYLALLAGYIAPEVMKRLGIKELRKRYYAIRWRLQKER